jgi:hypothetical protein
MAIGGLWIIIGIFTDLAWHVRHDIETFLTWSHALLYAGLFFSFAAVAFISLRNAKTYGVPLLRAMPDGYELAVPGVILFFIAGAADATGHVLWGFEADFNALLSPTHQLIGLSIVALLVGPIRSLLCAQQQTRVSLASQLPAIVAAGSLLGLVHWGLNPFFGTDAEAAYTPLAIHGFSPDALTLNAMLLSLQEAGLASVVMQTVLTTAVVLYLVRALAVRPGGITLALLLGNGFIAVAVAVSWSESIAAIVAITVAGLVGDFLLYRSLHRQTPPPLQGQTLPSAENNRRLAIVLGPAVPFTYHAVLYALIVIFLGGIWWNPIFLFGTLLYSAVFGFLLGLVISAKPSPAFNNENTYSTTR